jgi:type I restriction enzyme S subunit
MLFKESIKRFTPPKGWGWASIGDVAKLSFSSVDKKSVEGEKAVRLCNYMDVFYNRRIREGMPFMASTASDSDIKKFTLNKDDVVLTKDSETPEEIAFAAVIDEQIDNLVCGYHLAVLRPDKGKVTGEYLMSAINFHPNHHQFVRLANGATRFGLGIDSLNNALIPLPPLAEQRKIAEILRTWDEAIETAESELKAKQSLLKLAVDKYFERTYRDAASGTVGGLKTLDAVCTRKGEYGAAVSACPFNPEWPRYIRITDITDTGMLKKVRSVSISPESAEGYNLKIGDLLFARTGEPGRCLIFNEAYPAAFAGYLIRFKVRQEILLSDFVYFYTLSSVYDKWVGDVSQKGAQANINAKVYGSLQLPVTDLASQGVAVRVFKALQESVLLAERGVELLSAQKRGLMQKLLTGEVRVAA